MKYYLMRDNDVDFDEVELLEYDNNKYVHAHVITTGELKWEKRAYFFCSKAPYMWPWQKRNPLTRRFLFSLGGGNILNYKPRISLTEWHFWFNKKRYGFTTKEKAIKKASNVAIRSKEKIVLHSDHYGNRSSYYGRDLLYCYPDGDVLQYGGDGRRKRIDFSKYLRGHGKLWNYINYR